MDTRPGFLYPVTMRSPLLRDLLIHAVHEFRDSLRSKRAIVVLLVYLGGSILMCNGFISLLSELEESLLANLRVAPTDATGSVTQTLWKTPLLKDALTKLAGDPHLVAHLTRKEPLSVYFFWMTSIFAPVILMMISPTRVSDEMSTGSARFVQGHSERASRRALEIGPGDFAELRAGITKYGDALTWRRHGLPAGLAGDKDKADAFKRERMTLPAASTVPTMEAITQLHEQGKGKLREIAGSAPPAPALPAPAPKAPRNAFQGDGGIESTATDDELDSQLAEDAEFAENA